MSVIDIIGIVLGVIGGLGVVFAIITEKRNRKLAAEKTRFSWSDIESGCQQIARKIKKKKSVESIITFSGAGSIICNLSLLYSDTFLPVYTIIEYPLDKCPYDSLPGFKKTKSGKWIFFIPESLANQSNRKILIIHDCSISGEGLDAVKDFLISDFGYSNNNISAFVLITTESAIQRNANKGIENYFYKVDNSTFYYPWGKRR